MITMAKTFDMEHFEDAVISEVYVLVNGVKYPLIVEYEKESTTPVTSNKLNQIIDEIDTLCREGATSKDITISKGQPTTDDWKLWIPDGEVQNLGSEVVNTLSGNETNKSPSVKTINDLNTYSTEETQIGWYVKDDGTKVPLYRKEFRFNTASNTNWSSVGVINNIAQIVNCTGKLFIEGNQFYDLFDADYGSWYIRTDTGSISQKVKLEWAYSKPATMTVEYTKTTD